MTTENTEGNDGNTRVYTEAELAQEQAKARAAREEAKANRLAKEAAEAARATAEAQATEAAAKVAEATSKAQERVTRAEARAAAALLGAVDAKDVVALLDMSKVERDADGEPTNLDALISEMKTAKPHLFNAGVAATGSTSSTSKPPPKAAPEIKLAKDMTDEEYAAARAALFVRR